MSRILIPLATPGPMEPFHKARYTHRYIQRKVFGAGTPREWSRDSEETRHFDLKLSQMLCSTADVDIVTAFLRDLIAQKPCVGNLMVPVARPVLTAPEKRLMGIKEQGWHTVYFPDTETVTFTVIAPPAIWEAMAELLKAVASKVPAEPLLRNTMAAAYLTAWKAYPGNSLLQKPAFLSQTGFIDRHLGGLISFDTSIAEVFEGVEDLPPHGHINVIEQRY